jgi:hypothetical protein
MKLVRVCDVRRWVSYLRFKKTGRPPAGAGQFYPTPPRLALAPPASSAPAPSRPPRPQASSTTAYRAASHPPFRPFQSEMKWPGPPLHSDPGLQCTGKLAESPFMMNLAPAPRRRPTARAARIQYASEETRSTSPHWYSAPYIDPLDS